jgi:GDP-4-dehydro-6-deoxy-D-mannose reductase
VGGWLLASLQAAYPDAILFGTTFGGGELPAGVAAIEADLSLPAQVAGAIYESKPTHVFHLAGFASAAGTDEGAIHRANVDSTVLLLRAITAQATSCRVLVASSGYVYGPTERPAIESDSLRPRGAYAQSKAAMEEKAAPYASETLSLTLARAFNHTGPRQRAGFAFPDWASQLARIEKGESEPILRVGNLGSVRDFLDVRDVVEAYRLLACEAPAAPLTTVNVCSGEGVTMQSALDSLISQAEIPVRVEVDPAKFRDDSWASVGDPEKLIGLTGWRRTRTLTDTARETLAWWRAS